MHPLAGITPMTFMPLQLTVNNPGNVQAVVEFMSHDAVVQAVIINPMCSMYLNAPPSSNILRWRQIDVTNMHIQQAVREIMGD